MIKSKRCTFPFLVLSILFPMLCQGVFAQDNVRQNVDRITFLTLVEEFDDLCDNFSSEERSMLHGLIEYELGLLNMTREKLNEHTEEVQLDCNSELFSKMTNSVKEFLANLIETNTSDDSKQNNKNNRPEILDLLESNFNQLPTGKLTMLSGCWLGSLAGWNLKICIDKSGDKLTAMLTNSSDGASCELPIGTARAREGGALFYAYRDDYRCSDGSRLEHMEGFCNLIGDLLDCLVSVFENDNYFYTSNGNNLNGSVAMSRLTEK